MHRNTAFSKLNPTYLFVEVKERVAEFKKYHPTTSLISLAVGDTSLPISQVVKDAMKKKVDDLATEEKYTGYGDEEGELPLRTLIARVFYNDKFKPNEIFISDGAACDIGRLQILFGKSKKIAVQDPAYPAYRDTSLAMGCSELVFLPSSAEKHFFPDLEKAKGCDILFLCSPNNPTGIAASYEDLSHLVQFAKKHHILIVLDAAYNLFIDDDAPRSIYEIEGADEIAIELGSFSKLVSFTGVRLGWSVVPSALSYKEGGSIYADWKRVVTTFFNGASNIAQAGGMAALSEEGREEIKKSIAYYKENASLLKTALKKLHLDVYGGDHAPFLWVGFKDKISSWQMFDHFLHKYHIITTPGSGFGPSGEGFLRFSTLGKRDHILKAIERLSS